MKHNVHSLAQSCFRGSAHDRKFQPVTPRAHTIISLFYVIHLSLASRSRGTMQEDHRLRTRARVARESSNHGCLLYVLLGAKQLVVDPMTSLRYYRQQTASELPQMHSLSFQTQNKRKGRQVRNGKKLGTQQLHEPIIKYTATIRLEANDSRHGSGLLLNKHKYNRCLKWRTEQNRTSSYRRWIQHNTRKLTRQSGA